LRRLRLLAAIRSIVVPLTSPPSPAASCSFAPAAPAAAPATRC